jgi:hypothetical protein
MTSAREKQRPLAGGNGLRATWSRWTRGSDPTPPDVPAVRGAVQAGWLSTQLLNASTMWDMVPAHFHNSCPLVRLVILTKKSFSEPAITHPGAAGTFYSFQGSWGKGTK